MADHLLLEPPLPDPVVHRLLMEFAESLQLRRIRPHDPAPQPVRLLAGTHPRWIQWPSVPTGIPSVGVNSDRHHSSGPRPARDGLRGRPLRPSRRRRSRTAWSPNRSPRGGREPSWSKRTAMLAAARALVGPGPHPLANLRVAAQVGQLPDRPADHPLGLLAAHPVNPHPHPHPLAGPLRLDHDPLDRLADELLAVGVGGRRRGPQRRDIRGQPADRCALGLATACVAAHPGRDGRPPRAAASPSACSSHRRSSVRATSRCSGSTASYWRRARSTWYAARSRRCCHHRSSSARSCSTRLVATSDSSNAAGANAASTCWPTSASRPAAATCWQCGAPSSPACRAHT